MPRLNQRSAQEADYRANKAGNCRFRQRSNWGRGESCPGGPAIARP